MADEKKGEKQQPEDEFQHLAYNVPNELADLMSAYCDSQTASEYKNRMNYVSFLDALRKIEDVERKMSISLIGLKQDLCSKFKVSFASQVDKRYYGLSKSSFDQTFRTSVHKEINDDLKVHAESETSAGVKVGGIAEVFGGGGHVDTKLKAGTTYEKIERRASDFTSVTQVHAEMERFEPPEGVAILDQADAELLHEGVEANKILIQRQKDLLIQEVSNADPNVQDTEEDDQDADTSSDTSTDVPDTFSDADEADN